MTNQDFWMFCMQWLTTSSSQLTQLLAALVPVLALCIAGYALHVVNNKGNKKRGKND